ncbi:MAG TPA: hypothetical protein VMG61_13090, partial [Usitatibacter sp.]|nr:hypothetical protein [Usitatibacter sp.]
MALALAPQVASATSLNIIVNSNSDALIYDPVETGVITLRGALDYVSENCTGTGDTISFAGGPFTVNVSSDLPMISCPGLTIDGGGTKTSAVISLYNYGGNLNPALQANV